MIREHETPSSYVDRPDFDPNDRERNDEVISMLNELIETCEDGLEGFKQAAEGVKSDDLKRTFMKYSQERANYVADLQNLVRTLGGDPEDSGSTTGAIHRGWINIKSAVTGQDDSAILNECERGEDSAKSVYQNAQKQDMPDYVRATVEGQYAGVLAAHDNIRMLRDAAKNESASAARSVK
ncbi:MAG: PA2169 family four-helix-bundle protein [Pyrinomonadaceae bacterium]